MDLLKEVDTEDVPECNHVLEAIQNVMREDKTEETLNRQTFLANSPSHVGGMIRVPPVIKF
jgi:aspartyl-tRNA(Asn)/glutamyl-tRNA(Gln) amidotransferase subunit C